MVGSASPVEQVSEKKISEKANLSIVSRISLFCVSSVMLISFVLGIFNIF